MPDKSSMVESIVNFNIQFCQTKRNLAVCWVRSAMDYVYNFKKSQSRFFNLLAFLKQKYGNIVM